MRVKIFTQTVINRFGNLLLVTVASQQTFFTVIADKARLYKEGRNIRRTQNPEAGMSQPLDLNQLAQNIKQWGAELGFQKVGITDTDLSASEPKLQACYFPPFSYNQR